MPKTRVALARAKDWMQTFVADFATHGCVSYAAKAAGVDRNTVYRHLAGGPQADEAFIEAFTAAEEQARDVLRKEAHRRAVEGYEETVTDEDGNVRTTHKFSDRLLEKLLEARCPEHRPRSLLDGASLTPKDGETTLTLRWQSAPADGAA